MNRVKYRIDFDNNQWYLTDKSKLKSAVKDLKPTRCEVFEVTENLDNDGKILKSTEKQIKEEELK